jgi:hypothetical protein
MRKILTTLLAAAALTAAAQPAATQAACSNWQPDTDNAIYQGNGWAMDFDYTNGRWYATGVFPGEPGVISGDVLFSSWTADLVRFTITWSNGSGGIYSGTIDTNGFVSGIAEDRWTHATTTWHMRDVASRRG